MSDAVTVSMYNVGFGDCFLIRVPGAAADRRERTILVDCGSIKQGAVGDIDGVVEQIITDVTAGGVARIDVVVMTHRHKDHVSGFTHPAWRNVEVEQVWMPWTEDPTDPVAREVLDQMAGFAAALAAERSRLAPLHAHSDAEQELIDHVLANTLTLSNERAMATLHRGFANPQAPRRFLRRQSEPLDTDGLDFDDIVVHVLGPSHDLDTIREMNPPSDQSFLRVADGIVGGDEDLLPFEPGDVLPGQPSPDLQDLLRRFAGDAAIFGAVALEKAVNNTSLMLAFEIGDAVLLFPGDAQWGTWEQNLNDPITNDLLQRTTFYKVGHHGSHNATPVTFVRDVLNTDAAFEPWAAASVVEHGRFTEIPKHQLIGELGTKLGAPSRVVRSDQAPTKRRQPAGLNVQRKENKTMRVDFTVPIA